jgi:hypothetical protein
LARPPAGRQGEGPAGFGLGRGFQQFLGPVLATYLLVGLGAAGWLAFSGLFLAVGLVGLPLAVGWGRSGRHRRLP